MGPHPILSLLLLPLVAACSAPGSASGIVLSGDDLVIARDVVVRPGTYRVRDTNGDGVLHVVGDDVTVTLTGVTLDGADDGAAPDRFEGIGIAVTGARVRIVGGALRGFRIGLRGERADHLHVEALDVSGNRAMRLRSTPAAEDAADWLWPHDNDAGEWEARYGGGISLVDCAAATVERCRARGTQNGLLLTRCHDAAVVGNDFSFLSGWGIAMYRASGCRIEGNRCDWCVRGYSHGVYARGQDSAGILMFEQCSDNVVANNSATHGGDGLFLYAGHETTRRTGKGGSNRNRVIGNDFSCAVANGIEATFSEGNVFVDNRLDDCDHGVWAGYSYGTEIRGNTMARCANGVSIEHGHANTVAENALLDCAVGVHLWWDDDADLLASVYGRTQDTSSSHNVVADNRIDGGRTALRVDGDTGSRFERNRVTGAAVGLDARGATTFVAFEDNSIAAGLAVRCQTAAPLALGTNEWLPWRAEGPQSVMVAEPAAVTRTASAGAERVRAPVVGTGMGLPRGREHIVIGEWGPLDPRLPAVVPSGPSGEAAATLRVVGADLPFRVASLTDGFVAEPASGTAPAVVRIRRADGSVSSVAAWEADVRIGERAFDPRGTWVGGSWRVRWWEWSADPREDAPAFAALVATAPLDEVTVPALAFDWGAGRPSAKVAADRFATVAETGLDLPAGAYRLTTVSDDGVRVLVDGAVVLEDWTWHAPKEQSVRIVLEGGHHAIRVEHFEIDGWAALRCWIEPDAGR